MISQQIQKSIRQQANPEKAKTLMRFFKTGEGEYGDGDLFLGLTVPQQRKIVKQYKSQIIIDNFEKILTPLITHKYHEFRLVALLLLVQLCQNEQKLIKKGTNNKADWQKLISFYLQHTRYVNNWDLVDLSAHEILGQYYYHHQNEIDDLYQLAKSKSLWEKRIAMISMYTFIRQNEFKHPLQIAELLVNDRHDLLQKAVGWMLREIGKRNQQVEEDFLKKYYKTMPRTMLRYAIEKFDKKKKDFYMGR